MRNLKLMGTVMLALATAACGDGLGPAGELDQQVTEDAALVAADAALDDLQQMAFTGLTAQLSMEGRPLEASRTVTFLDAEGNPMDQYDPQLTASINVVVEVAGEVERSGWVATVARSRNLTVSGLEGEETSRTWNGTGEGTVTGSRHTDGDGTREYVWESSAVIADVVVNLPREEFPWPMSGTITRTITATVTVGDRTETRTRTAILEFNGTQFATLTIGDEVFEVDLAARSTDRPHRLIRDRR